MEKEYRDLRCGGADLVAEDPAAGDLAAVAEVGAVALVEECQVGVEPAEVGNERHILKLLKA